MIFVNFWSEQIIIFHIRSTAIFAQNIGKDELDYHVVNRIPYVNITICTKHVYFFIQHL